MIIQPPCRQLSKVLEVNLLVLVQVSPQRKAQYLNIRQHHVVDADVINEAVEVVTTPPAYLEGYILSRVQSPRLGPYKVTVSI